MKSTDRELLLIFNIKTRIKKFNNKNFQQGLTNKFNTLKMAGFKSLRNNHAMNEGWKQ